MLWSKPLSSGVMIALDATTPGEYLHHKSTQGSCGCGPGGVCGTDAAACGGARPVLPAQAADHPRGFYSTRPRMRSPLC